MKIFELPDPRCTDRPGRQPRNWAGDARPRPSPPEGRPKLLLPRAGHDDSRPALHGPSAATPFVPTVAPTLRSGRGAPR